LLDLGRFSVPWSLTQSVGPLWRGISPSQGRHLHAQDNINTEYTHTDIHAWSWTQHTIPVFERAKTIHGLYRAATVIGYKMPHKNLLWNTNI
jgi:hypothetical protein